jgi:hypothetical protein
MLGPKEQRPSADNKSMAKEERRSKDPASGDPVTVKPRDPNSGDELEGRLVKLSRFMITIDIPDPSLRSFGDEVVLAFGPAELRFAALAKMKGATADGTRFMRRSPWRPVNTRAFPRFDVDISLLVLWDDGKFAGRPTNLSFSGGAMKLGELPVGDVIQVRLGHMNPLAARVVQVATDNDEHLVRFEFTEPTEEAQWEIEDLILAEFPDADKVLKRAS